MQLCTSLSSRSFDIHYVGSYIKQNPPVQSLPHFLIRINNSYSIFYPW